MTNYETNSIWGIEPRATDTQSKRDMDCKCSRCKETKSDDIFIYVWNDDVSLKYCEECSVNRFECDYKFQTVRNELAQ